MQNETEENEEINKQNFGWLKIIFTSNLDFWPLKKVVLDYGLGVRLEKNQIN